MTLLLQALETAGNMVENSIIGNPSWLVVGIVFFIGAALVLFFLKNIIVNTVLGVIGWAILTYVFHVQLPLLISLVVSAIFGLAGLGVLLVLAFLGITF